MEFPFDLTPEQDTLPAFTSADRPLEIWLEKDVLAQQIRKNLQSFRDLRGRMDGNVEGFLWAEELLEQRSDFLTWLESYPLTGIYVSLVPVAMRELTDGAEGGDDGEPGELGG